jgi:hypothetical protein
MGLITKITGTMVVIECTNSHGLDDIVIVVNVLAGGIFNVTH